MYTWCVISVMFCNDIYMICILQYYSLCTYVVSRVNPLVLCNGGPVDVCNHELRGPGTNIKGGSASQLRHGAATIRAEM